MRASLAIYDVLGRKVRRLADGDLPAGSTAIRWDGRDAAGSAARTGMYFARLATPKGNRVLRLPLIR
jgi:flagellar hook assembly protein FlgD